MSRFGVLVHGGAGEHPADWPAEEAMKAATGSAHALPAGGGTAVGAVLDAIHIMEASGPSTPAWDRAWRMSGPSRLPRE